MSVCKSKEKMKITDFFWTIFLKMGTSPKSSVFATVGSRTSTNGVVQRGNTTGTTIGKHNGGNKTGNSREKWKKMYVFWCIFYLLNCFKIISVCKSKEKMKITHFFWTIFMKMGTSPKSSVFATVGSRTSTNGVVQRGNTTGTTIGKHNAGNKTGNSREKWKKCMYVYVFFIY